MSLPSTNGSPALTVSLLTGGQDKPYALGISAALASKGIAMDYIGSDDVDAPELHVNPLIRFLNLRGNQRTDASKAQKVIRVLKYYARLLRYAVIAKPRVFHILWTEKFEVFDRVLLMLFYRLLGRRIVHTAHNVNARKRDNCDTFMNRLTLRIQYALTHKIFVHTKRMHEELITDFKVPPEKAIIIPFGINNTLPNTTLTPEQARQALGLVPAHKVLLFFGRVTPYKGLEHLIGALAELAKKDDSYRVLVAGPIKNCSDYWLHVQEMINKTGVRAKVIEHTGFIPDEKVEVYFKAADVVILPYTDIFQSGVLSLGYSFGLPVVVTDVGSLKEDVIEGRTGFSCRPKDPVDLANAIGKYFASDLFKNLKTARQDIRDYANERYSWSKVADITRQTYLELTPS